MVIHKLLEVLNNQDVKILNLERVIDATMIQSKKEEAEIIDVDEED